MSNTKEATVQEAKSVDLAKNIFDGKKADLFINTNRLGGKVYTFEVTTPGETKPTLIAIHL